MSASSQQCYHIFYILLRVIFFFPLIREPLDRKRIEDECLLDRTDT